MEYFELRQSNKVVNAVKIINLRANAYNYVMADQDFQALDKLKVAYFSGQDSEELCAILTAPTYLVSDQLKTVLKLYDKEMEFKGIQLFPLAEERKLYPLYWVPHFKVVQCLHETAEKYDNGRLKKIVLDKRTLEGISMARVGELLEYKVVVSLPVAESILRRRLYGVQLEKAEVI